MKSLLHRACAHDSTRALLCVLALGSMKPLAELICRMAGVGSF